MMTTSRRWARRSLIVVGLIALVAVLWLLFGARTYVVPIAGYRVVDDQTIVVQVVAGRRSWCQLTKAEETAAQMQFSAKCTDWLPLPGTAVGQTHEFTVRLREPLNDRVVVDGDGVPVALEVCRDNVCAPSETGPAQPETPLDPTTF